MDLIRKDSREKKQDRIAVLPVCLFPELHSLARPDEDPDPVPNAFALNPTVWPVLRANGFDLSAPVVLSASQEPGAFSIFQKVD